MQLIVRPRAEAQIRAARDWYEAERSGLGGRFVLDLSQSYDRIREYPLQYPDIGGARRCVLRKFPYSIYYIQPEADRVVVLAVLHHRRKPGLWRLR